ncbi:MULTISPECIES: hypothetical protein [Lysinibacillus]|uniref:hypothetical protein n=1 Tax=Lysinibacillus TaxID=400634 RepID=UPI00214C6FAC|nr:MULTISPECIES: hypothetical protein [Lysinibacillus]UUV25990.1 hypothetical protein NP781_05045 [Lysinibacillus sp. FN11]UYB48863.1 hypothetical protein OCI51_07835 [Lysinibacillus capsici]
MTKDTLKEVIQFEKDLAFVRDFLDKLPKEVEYLSQLVDQKQREQEDLLHHIEFETLPANKGYEADRKLHIVRNERRKAKDMLDVMKSAYDKLKPKLPNISIFNNTLGDVRGIINKQKNRKYKPRELTDITYGSNNTYTNT